MLGSIVAAALVLAGLVVFLPLAFKESQAAPPQVRAVTRAQAQALLDRAAAALRAGDHAAFLAALPTTDPGARKAIEALYTHLQPLPWTGFSFDAAPSPGHPGRFVVRAYGMLGRAGPADRVAAERDLDFARLGARIVVAGDHTPEVARREYLMWTHQPLVIQRNGLVVVADRRVKKRALRVADAGAAARLRLAAELGLRPKAAVVVSLYSSLEDMQASLGGGPVESRFRFFSNAGPRMALQYYRVRDIGVLGPSLDGTGAWLPLMLAHELTHAYTLRWFLGTKHAPMFLEEGLGMAVEQGRSWAPLKEEVASGNQLWPLPDVIATKDLWKGNSTDQVRLGYLEAGSVILYVAHRWGLDKVKPFVIAVADSDLSTKGVGDAVQSSLGVSWNDFYAGWEEYVRALP
ncbi:MAG TPA: hypothetical protein VFD50_04910 [Thermoleophilia bacterium]|nr:hypothetical protein [Thermoleophilia bacterium]